jgi:4-hydroxybenzoate polyprenyltransferase
VWLFEFFWLRLDALQFAAVLPDLGWVTTVFTGYAAFAFLTSMVREIIKDMEDAEGDETAGCRTLPLVAGMKKTKLAVAAILIATILILAYAQVVLYLLDLQMAFWYFMITVQAGALYLLVKLFQAKNKQDYHFLSNLCKLIMVAGILSMQIVLISN